VCGVCVCVVCVGVCGCMFGVCMWCVWCVWVCVWCVYVVCVCVLCVRVCVCACVKQGLSYFPLSADNFCMFIRLLQGQKLQTTVSLKITVHWNVRDVVHKSINVKITTCGM